MYTAGCRKQHREQMPIIGMEHPNERRVPFVRAVISHPEHYVGML